MITIKNNTLIIEIPCSNNNPIEILGELQCGLHSIIEIIDYKDAPKESIDWAMLQISKLLKNIAISPEQLSAMNNQVFKNEELKSVFLKQDI